MSNLIAASDGAQGAMIVFVLLTVFWFLPIYVAGRMTSGKHQGWAIGIVLGLLLGWIGVLIALLMPYKPEESRRRRPYR